MTKKTDNFSATVRSPDALGQALKRARLAQNMTQAELGALSQTHQRLISRLETGNKGNAIETIFRLMSLLDMEIIVQSRQKSSVQDIVDMFE